MADIIGVSDSTLYRLLKKNNVCIPSGLIYHKDQIKIMEALGLDIAKLYQ